MDDDTAAELNRVLTGCTDAQVWAREFIRMLTKQEGPGAQLPVDEGTMIGWFANAIMSGYDEGERHERQRDFMEKLHEVIYQAAGAATLPFMQRWPDLTFPSEEVIEGVEAVLKDFGIPSRERNPLPQ